MSNLISTQQNLLEAIFIPSGELTESMVEDKGLQIYRANLRATALQALCITFPTINALIGEGLMSYATEKMLNLSPPKDGNWARWGESFAAVLEDIEPLKEFAYLPDCARLDYLCHQLVREANFSLDTDSLSLLQNNDPAMLKIELAPTLHLLRSPYPIQQIRDAHKLQALERKKALASISFADTTKDGYFVACYRNGYTVSVNAISSAEYQWYQLLEKHSLGASLDLIDLSAFSFENWLRNALQEQIIHKISLC